MASRKCNRLLLLLLLVAEPPRGCGNSAAYHLRKTTVACAFSSASLETPRRHTRTSCSAAVAPVDSSRRARKQRLRKQEYQRRRDRWTERYGSLEALQSTFGKGPPWGDLSPTQTRALYHTLLPRSLLALNEMKLMKPDELAPLAYEARIAAKEYARSRCVWTGRVATSLFDQYRSLRDKGRLLKPGSSGSMSWEEIWAKYEGQIVREVCENALKDEDSNETDEKKEGKSKKRRKLLDQLDDEDLTMRIYLRILEKSCATNQAFDSLFLETDGSAGNNSNLASIASQLDSDVRSILLSPNESIRATKKEKKMEEKRQKSLEKEEKVQLKAERKEKKLKRIHNRKEQDDESISAVEIEDEDRGSDGVLDHDFSKRYGALRILAGTRRQFKLVFDRSR